MATAKQVAANQANAQKSCGPTSPAGKAKSSVNRLTWGFASNTIVMPGEDPDEFRGLLEDFIAEYQPETHTQQLLVEKMAQHQWLSLRAYRLQGECFLTHKLRCEKSPLPPELPVLIRYRTTADNAFHKALNELLKLKKQSQNSENGFVPQIYGHEAGAMPEERPEPAPVIPISTNSSPRPRDLVFADQEIAFDLCPEALEFLKKVG